MTTLRRFILIALRKSSHAMIKPPPAILAYIRRELRAAFGDPIDPDTRNRDTARERMRKMRARKKGE